MPQAPCQVTRLGGDELFTRLPFFFLGGKFDTFTHLIQEAQGACLEWLLLLLEGCGLIKPLLQFVMVLLGELVVRVAVHVHNISDLRVIVKG